MKLDGVCYLYSDFQEFLHDLIDASGRLCRQHFRQKRFGFLLHIDVSCLRSTPNFQGFPGPHHAAFTLLLVSGTCASYPPMLS